MSRSARAARAVTALAVAGTLCAPVHAQPAVPSATGPLHQQAEDRYARGDLQGAAELYVQIADQENEPRRRSAALLTAGWLQHLLGDAGAAMDSLVRCLVLTPDQPFDAALYNRQFELLYGQAREAALAERQRRAADQARTAVRALEEGREAEARDLLESALELDSEQPAALYHLALLDLRADRTGEALAALERVVTLSQKLPGGAMSELRLQALMHMGEIYRSQRRFLEAERALTEATRADPASAAAWRNLGLLHLDLDSPERAAAALERAHELDPDDREVILALRDALTRAGRPGRATAMLRSVLQRRPDDGELWLALGALEQQQGDSDQARWAFERAVTADPDNQRGFAVSAELSRAALELQRDDLEAALIAANRAIGWDRSSHVAWSLLGRAQLASGETSRAISSLTRAVELDPTAPETSRLLGDAMAADGQLDRAEAAYLRALSLDPDSAEVRASLEQLRQRLATERAIVAGEAKPRKPVPPKKIGLDFAGIDYRDLQLRGALVKEVRKKSPAALAGLRKGDLILWIGEYAVLSDKDFFQFLKRSPPGDSLAIEYLRDGRIHSTEIALR